MRNSEYYGILNDRIAKYKENNEDIANLVDSINLSGSKPNDMKKMYIVFLSRLKQMGINEEIYNRIKKVSMDKLNIERTYNEHDFIMGPSLQPREICTFENMMIQCFEKNGIQFMENALKNSMNQFENNKEHGNIIDNFITYTAAHEYDEIKYGIWKDANEEGAYEASLYGYVLGKIHLDKVDMSNGNEEFALEGFMIRSNLRGLKIGSYLLQKLMKDMKENNPERMIVANTVMMSNIAALKMYDKFGADVYANGKIVEDPINGMNHDTKKNCLVVFNSNVIKKNAEMIIEKPTKKIGEILMQKSVDKKITIEAIKQSIANREIER